MNLSAVILAGGQSSRMGRDKAFLEIEGKSLLQRQIETVRLAGAAELLISGRAGVDYSACGLPVVFDQFPEAGPLSGIHAAWSLAQNQQLLVLAVDLPLMSSAFLRNLAVASVGGRGVIPRLAGQIEPLVAIYSSAAREIAGGMLRRGEFAVRRFAHTCVSSGFAAYMDLPADNEPLFKNLNSPDDFLNLS